MQSLDPWMVILASGAIGVVIGVALAQLGTSSRVKAATEKERKRFEQEKAEVSQQINTQLTEMRDGLIQTVKAYDHAVRLVDEKLGSPTNVIESSNQLHLELKEEEPFKEEPFTSASKELPVEEDSAEETSSLLLLADSSRASINAASTSEALGPASSPSIRRLRRRSWW